MNKYEKALDEILETNYTDQSQLNYDMEETYLFDGNENSISVIRELVKRATPIEQRYDNCSECGSATIYGEDKFCNQCGQALDWNSD